MGPSHHETHIANNVITYTGFLVQQPTSRCDKRIAKSTEFQDCVLRLSVTAPSVMLGLLKKAFRKCEEALHTEKVAQATKKRAAPAASSNGNDRSAKRVRITLPTEEETAVGQGVAVSDSMAQQKDANSSSENLVEVEKDLDVKSEGNHSSSMTTQSVVGPQESDAVVMPSKYDIESGLTRPEPTIQAYVTASLLAMKTSTTRSHSNIRNEIATLLRKLLYLEPYTAKRQLHQYLEDRAKMPGEKLQTRTDWNVSDPGKILDALHTVTMNTTDNKIHRTYGRALLFSSVNALVARGYKSTVNSHRFDHTAILEELAREKAGPVSKLEVEQKISSYLVEYYAGQKWSAVIDWFGGSGIVLVFLTAGK